MRKIFQKMIPRNHLNSIIWGNITIWNMRNDNIEVTSKVFKELSETRSVVYLVIDYEKGFEDNVKQWVSEIIKINPWGKYNWISCVNIFAFNVPEKKDVRLTSSKF